LRLFAPAPRLARGRDTLLHERHEFARHEHIHTVARAPPRRIGPAIASSSGWWPAATSFCIELCVAPGTVAMEGTERILVDRDPLRAGDRNDLRLSSFEPCAPPWIVAHGTDRFAERRCCESDGRQERKLLPQHFRFVVAHRAFDSGRAQLACDFVATRSQLDADEGRLLACTRQSGPRPDSTRIAPATTSS